MISPRLPNLGVLLRFSILSKKAKAPLATIRIIPSGIYKGDNTDFSFAQYQSAKRNHRKTVERTRDKQHPILAHSMQMENASDRKTRQQAQSVSLLSPHETTN